MTNIYFIGGSPCSGKSTIAEELANRYGYYYFKVDDFIEEYTQKGAALKYSICKKQMEMDAEQIWMRAPSLQCEEEIQFYEEIFDFVLRDIERVSEGRDIITEGAAYLPHLMEKIHIPKNRYVAITPTRDFQITRYREREWIQYVLAGCSDFHSAFENWMNRDALFANQVNESCKEAGYTLFVNDGKNSINSMIHMVSKQFGLEE